MPQRTRVRRRLRRVLLAALAALLAVSSGETNAEAASRPNVVLIMADDLGTETLGSYGGRSYRTPNLDRLASSGRRFTHAYAQPLCSNTRVELMTGRRATRDWIGFGLIRPDAVTFGHRFRDAGYATGLFGKWQLTSYDPPDYPGAAERRGTGMPISEAGFDRYVAFHAGQTEAKGSRYADPTFTVGEIKTEPDGSRRLSETVVTYPGKYGPEGVNAAAQQFLVDHADKAKSGERPFFLYYPMMLPHWPMTPAADTDAYRDPTRRDEADVRHFPGMVHFMDRMVGKLHARLRALGLAENTVVLFYSDNGTHQQVASLTDDGWVLGGKGLMDDTGTHVPLIAAWPGRIAAGESDALIGPVDFVPTLIELCGLEAAEQIDGVSFAPVLTGDPTDAAAMSGPRQTLTIDFEPRPGWDKDRFRRQTFVRDRRWKLYRDGRLFDLGSDPRERRPTFAGEPDDEASVREQLAAAMPPT